MKTDTRRETQKEDFSSFVALFHLQELEGKLWVANTVPGPEQPLL